MGLSLGWLRRYTHHRGRTENRLFVVSTSPDHNEDQHEKVLMLKKVSTLQRTRGVEFGVCVCVWGGLIQSDIFGLCG